MSHDEFDPLDSLDAALNVEPSPEFSARVRMAVAENRRPAGFRTWWLWASAATVAVVGGVLLVVSATPNVTPADVAPISKQAQAPIAVRASAPAELEVLVPPDQAIALAQLLNAIHEGRLRVPAQESILDENGRLIVPSTPTIPPVTIELLPITPPNGKGKE
jgi:hypothetical protein